MAGGNTAMFAATWAMRAATLLSMVVYYVAAQETCTSVTVTGGEFPGVYEQGTGDSSGSFLRTVDGSTQVLQAVAFGASRARRNLGGGGSRRRGLANDCSTQMWVLTDSSTASTVADEGFPYYSTFDCADHPASVESTWLLVGCETCSEVAPVSVVCTAEVGADDGALGTGDGDGGGALALPAIISIAAGGLMLLLCLGFCFSRHKKRAHKGSHTFADDSEHSMAQQKNAAAGGAAVAGAPNDGSANGSRAPVPAYSAAVGATVESPLGPGAVSAAAGGGSGGLGFLSKGANNKSFKPTSGPTNPAYEGIFATRSSAGGGGNSSQGGNSASTMAHPPVVEMRSKFGSPEMVPKDSMAAAAAAASASATSRSQGGSGMHDVDMNSPRGFGNVLSSGVVEGRSRGMPPQQQQRPPERAARGAGLEGGAGAGDGGGIAWSAGQNINHHRRGGYPASNFGGDSAAGSVYELQPPDDDEDVEHTYHNDGCDDSVAASSPGAYSMYSHYTAGGGMYGGGGLGGTWSSDEGSGLRPEDRVGGGGVGGGGGESGGGRGTIPSPATLGARNGPRGTLPGGAEGASSSRR